MVSLSTPQGHAADDVELGYRLRKSAWGKGYATEGSRALIAIGFTNYGVKRVFASTLVVNNASQRVMQKAGLHFVHILHRARPKSIPGDEYGDTEYELTIEQWRAQQQPPTGASG